jgi:hypothetical protein
MNNYGHLLDGNVGIHVCIIKEALFYMVLFACNRKLVLLHCMQYHLDIASNVDL